MHDTIVPCVGGILSADIAVPEHEREMRFYTRVLCTGENPLWRDDLMNSLGTPIIGLGARTPEYELLPLHWMPHIQVADVATSVDRALDRGGTELMHGKDDDGVSQWAVLLDPNGAAFGIIPVVSANMIPQVEAAASRDPSTPTGRICGLDLTVADASATRDFYQKVSGWAVLDVPVEDASGSWTDYDMLGADGNRAARIRHARGENTDLPPAWMVHLPVDDLPESLRRVEAEGGTVLKSTEEGDGERAHAVVRDPVGACFVLTSARARPGQ